MRLVPRSIHGRMLALSVLATLVALAVAGAAIAGVLQRFVTQGLDQRLDAELSLLAGAVGADGRIDRAKLTRLRGLLDAGPEWRWQIVAPTGAIGSDVLADLDRRPPFRGGRMASDRRSMSPVARIRSTPCRRAGPDCTRVRSY
ncbi:hypothetical protein [Sphingomonas sp. 22R3R2A-7]|uniref:hypothetical protein n=1 Tax=Sphingomonas sp. 22R3R2A-7 TaxID=3050230 RepID=UPI002FE35BD0